MNHSVLIHIRQIARAGDTGRAWQMFEDAGLCASQDAEALSLKGRLLKDRALRGAQGDRTHLLDEAQAAYLAAAGGRRATYPLINAATIAFLNGHTDRARDLARHILALLDSGEHEPETRYWLGATAAEAQLLLGNPEASRRLLDEAIATAPGAWEDHAATLRQLQQILAMMGIPVDLFDHLHPPASLYFSGIIGLPADEAKVGEMVEEALDRLRPGAVFGALAAGADIMIAECAIARGADLHVVLPMDVNMFREISVAQFGDRWTSRFDDLISAAHSIETLERVSCLSDAAIRQGAEAAMGLALRHARSLATHAVALHVGRASDLIALPDSEWRKQGLPYFDLVVEDAPSPAAPELASAAGQAILASPHPFPADAPSIFAMAELSSEGCSILRIDDLAMAVDMATQLLRIAPDGRLGLDYRAVSPVEGIDEWGALATQLARGAPQGGICAPWPGIAAIDLYDPDHAFEAAGDMVTPIGDFPIGLLCPSPVEQGAG